MVYGFLSVCAYLCLWVCVFFMSVSGGMCPSVQSTSPKSLISLPRFPHPAFWVCAKQNLFLAALARHEGTSEECSQHALQHAMHLQVWGSLLPSSLLDGIFQPHIINYNKLTASWPTVQFPQWAVSFQVHSAHATVSNQRVSIFKSGLSAHQFPSNTAWT